MSGSSDNKRTREELFAFLEEMTDELPEQLAVLVDQLGDLLKNGSANPKRSRSERIVDIERLSRVYERLRKSAAEQLAGEAPEAAQTLLDLLTLEENGGKGEEEDPPQEGTTSGPARG